MSLCSACQPSHDHRSSNRLISSNSSMRRLAEAKTIHQTHPRSAGRTRRAYRRSAPPWPRSRPPTKVRTSDRCVRESSGSPTVVRSYAGEPVQSLSRHPVHAPVAHGYGADRFVELDGWFVPVENGPLQPSAAALFGQPREAREHRFSYPPSTELGPDVDVLQVDTRLSQKGREVVEE